MCLSFRICIRKQILSNDKCMELKFVRRWKFSTRNNNQSMTPAVAMRVQRIQRDNEMNNGHDINDNESDESDSTGGESSDEEENEVEVLNYFSFNFLFL